MKYVNVLFKMNFFGKLFRTLVTLKLLNLILFFSCCILDLFLWFRGRRQLKSFYLPK